MLIFKDIENKKLNSNQILKVFTAGCVFKNSNA